MPTPISGNISPMVKDALSTEISRPKFKYFSLINLSIFHVHSSLCPKPSYAVQAVIMTALLLSILTLTFGQSWQESMNELESAYPLRGQTIKEINERMKRATTIRKEVGLLDSDTVFYDPVLFTMSAGIESTAKKYQDEVNWTKTSLIPIHNAYYMDAVQGYAHTNKNSDTLFIIKGSSFSTWKAQTWVAKTSAILKTKLDNPNILAFPGFLTPEYLKHRPLFPDVKGDVMARDMYIRLKRYVEAQNFRRKTKITKVGLIGFSGGASEVIALLNEDADRKLFNLGGLAFSPILSQQVTFELLDSSADKLVSKYGRKAASSAGFTTFFNWSTMGLAKEFFNYSNLSLPLLKRPKISMLLKESENSVSHKEERLKRVFFNEFVVVDLRNTIKGFRKGRLKSGALLPKFRWIKTTRKMKHRYRKNGVLIKGNRHRHFWMDYAIEGRRRYENDPSITAKELLNPLAPFKNIKSRLYVVFPKDDPVLSNRYFHDKESESYQKLPAPIEAVLNADHPENIRFFTPNMGGHMGYFLDKTWLTSVLQSFFVK